VASANADQNVLFGMLAVQTGFITQEQLSAGMQAWVLNKSKPLGEVLVDQGVLKRDQLAQIDARVVEHLRKHSDDTEMSLRALDYGRGAKAALRKIGDGEIDATLCKIPEAPKPSADPFDTLPGSSEPAGGSGSGFAGGSTAGLSGGRSGGFSGGYPIGGPAGVAREGGPSALRFRVIRHHARGGLGEVLVAQDEELQREVALKQMLENYADHEESRTRFLIEAEITGALEHPGIVPVYGLGQYVDGRPYYAMRFIRGDSLKEAIEKFHQNEQWENKPGERTLALHGLLRRFVDVCQAMAYAHSRGVLHRDLKPGNIMLGAYGETLVVDWGLAKPLGQIEATRKSTEKSLMPRSVSGSTPTMDGAAVGTPQYMSPEQAAGRQDLLGPASDVYSLGGTLYCLLTGSPPIMDPNVLEVLAKVERGEFPPPRQVRPDVPAPLEAICLKAMKLKLEDRYATATLMAEDIERWLADEPVSCFPEPWTKKAARWLRRHRTLALSTASAVAVALVGLIIATTLLTAANERERQAKMEALAQKDKAEKNFVMAREAVDRYHTEVSESVLLNEPGMEPLRKKLLEAAREFYDRFTAMRAGDPDLKGEFGRAQYRLAEILGEIDSVNNAIALHQKARQVFVSLGEEFLPELAKSDHNLGRLNRKAKHLGASRKSYEEALGLWTRLKDADPKNVFYQAEWARTALGLGNVFLEEGQLVNAIEQYEKSLVIRAGLAASDGKNVDYRRDLAVTHGNLALAYLDLGGKAKEADREFSAAIEILESMVKAQPFLSQYRDDLARTLYSLGDLRRKNETPEKAIPLYEEARDHWDLLVQRHPSVLRFHVRLAEALGSLAELYNRAKQPEKALFAGRKALDTRVKLAEENASASYRGDLARGHFQLAGLYADQGKGNDAEAGFDKAARLQEELVKAVPEASEYRADLARTYNELGRLLVREKKLEPAEKALFRSTDLWEALFREAPDKAQFAAGLSAAAINLRQLLRLGGDLAQAKKRITQSLAALQTTEPAKRTPAMQTALGNLFAARAEVGSRNGEFALALDDWRQALDLAPSTEKPWLKLYQAMTIALTGDHARAAETADQFAKSGTKNGEALYLLTCIYSLAAAAADKDVKLPPKEREAKVAGYVRQGIALFSRAFDVGYFSDIGNQNRLSLDPSLEMLRGNTEFQGLMRKAMSLKGS